MKTRYESREMARFGLALLLTLLPLTACNGCDDTPPEGAACSPASPCPEGQTCQAGTCMTSSTTGDMNPLPGTDLGGTGDMTPNDDMTGGRCGVERMECGSRCCPEGYACGANNQCECTSNVFCDGICCGEGQLCELGQCVDPCGGVRCGAQLEQCCAQSEVCLLGECTTPGASCRFNEDCAAGEICEGLLNQCIPKPAELCEYRPPVGVFEPVIGCEWRPNELSVDPIRGDVVAAPIVLDLVDEGEVDGEEIPEIAFPSFDRKSQGCCNAASTLRIVSGKCEGDEVRTLVSINEPPINNDVGIAGGDLDGDGHPEIVAVINKSRMNANGNLVYYPEGTVAFTRADATGNTWKVLWTNETYPINGDHTAGGPTISLADLDQDGSPEVIIGSVVLNGQTGELKWDGTAMSVDEREGQGHNVFGPVSSVVDVDDDGKMEVFAGNTLYRHDGEVRWRFMYDSEASQCSTGGQGKRSCDGYDGVVDFDGDMEPELVSVRLGQIWVINKDGTPNWKVTVPVDDCINNGNVRNESGPPTVADFDGDGRPEIGTAGADFYVVADQDCDTDNWEGMGCHSRGILWAVPNEDCSSRSTASSVFDFEGDGAAEVVYADETTFRIFSGKTGEILFESNDHQSNTRIEEPVIADVDNDNNAEVIVASAWGDRMAAAYGDRGKAGLRIWQDASDNWVRTRRIWNQHSYHVTNVEDDGTIPRDEPSNWKIAGLNNYRQNVQPNGLFDAPDLLVREVRTGEARCEAEGVVEIYVLVGNDGALGIPEGALLTIEAVQGDKREPIYETRTDKRLLPGQTITLTTEWTVSLDFSGAPFRIEVTVDGEMIHNECHEDNNTALSDETTCKLQG